MQIQNYDWIGSNQTDLPVSTVNKREHRKAKVIYVNITGQDFTRIAAWAAILLVEF